MLEQLDDDRKQEPKWYGARILAGSVAGLLVAFGLCGAGSSIHVGGGMGVLSTMGIAVFGLSLLGIVIGVIVLVVEAIAAATRR